MFQLEMLQRETLLPDQIYLCYNAMNVFIFVGQGADPSLIQEIYKVDDFSQINMVLTEEEMFVNNWVNYYRQRVEHIMAVVKKHAAFRQDFRGSHILLRAMVDLTAQMSNCAIKRGWEPVPAMRYPGHDFGPHNAHEQY